MKSNENVVSIQIPEKELEAMIKKTQELQAMLDPYLIGLTPMAAERDSR